MKLSGIRVLDFSRFLPGPYLTMLMADHGAEAAIPGQPITPHITEGYHRAFLRNMRSLGQDSSALFLAVGLSQGPLLPAKLWKRLSLSIWL